MNYVYLTDFTLTSPSPVEWDDVEGIPPAVVAKQGDWVSKEIVVYPIFDVELPPVPYRYWRMQVDVEFLVEDGGAIFAITYDRRYDAEVKRGFDHILGR